VTAGIEHRRGTIGLDVSVRNVRAGHPVPTGLPERRIVVEAEAIDKSGKVTGRATASYGRHLVDGSGRPAPFYLAESELNDNRIRPKESRRERFSLSAANQGTLKIRVLWRAVDPDIARRLGLDHSETEVLGETSLAFGDGTLGRPQQVQVSK
jgi:hypothetical protein